MTRRPKSTLAQVVRDRRKALGLSLAAVAEKVGCSASHIHHLESGGGSGSPKFLAALAMVLDLPPEALAASAGRVPSAVTDYLAEFPEAAEAVARLFQRARKTGFSKWQGVDVEFPALASDGE